jgi:hypothetical protein
MTDEIPQEAIEAEIRAAMSDCEMIATGAPEEEHVLGYQKDAADAHRRLGNALVALSVFRKQFEDEHRGQAIRGCSLAGIEGAACACDGHCWEWVAVDDLLREWVDEHPVLAVIGRAREEAFVLTMTDGPAKTAGINLWSGRNRIGRAYGDSLDECARELLANWPEKT